MKATRAWLGRLSLILTVATLLATLCTGFAVWYEIQFTNNTPPEGNQGLKMHSYAIDDSSVVGVTMKQNGMSVFNYSATSFTAGGAETNEGSISVTYVIDKDALFGDTSSTTLVFTLSYLHAGSQTPETPENKTLFNPELAAGQSMEVGATVNGANATLTRTGAALSVETTLDKADCPEEITVVYTFRIPSDNGNFRKVFGKYLYYERPNTDGVTETTTFISTVTRKA